MNKDVFRKLRQMLMEELDLSRELSDKEILDVIDELILNQIKDVRLALKEKVQLRQELFYSVRKLDVLQELVDDETVTEIMVNGPDTIFVERAGKLMKWHKSFTSAEKLEDVIQQQIELARQQADIVVVGVHWGVEGSHTPTDAQRALGQKIADWGADVIIGTHPHVIQPVELLTAAGTGKTVPIAYSLGNFVSTQAAANNMVGVILTFDITKTTQPDGSASASVGNVHAVPMVMHYDSNYTNARAYLYRDYTEELAAAHGVRARFSGFSKEYITQLLTEYISPEFLVLE